MTFVTASFISSIVSERHPLSLGNNQSHREQALDYKEAEELCWGPSWSYSLWQGCFFLLVQYPGGNATEPIWKVLVSSDGIPSWTPLKPQHSTPHLNTHPLANQLWCVDFLTPLKPLIIPHKLPAFLESLMPLKNWSSIHESCSKSSLKPSIRFCDVFFSCLKQNFIAYRSSKVFSRPDCIFEIHRLRQLGFSRVYSNCCWNHKNWSVISEYV